MTEATIELPDGTVIRIKGSDNSVKDIIDHVSAKPGDLPRAKGKKAHSAPKSGTKTDRATEDDLANLLNTIKTSDEFGLIEEKILDSSNELNKALLPLYICMKYFENRFPLTTVEISSILTELASPISRQQALRALKGSGSSMVITKKIRKPGKPTLFNLNRRGEKHLQEVLSAPDSPPQTKKTTSTKSKKTSKPAVKQQTRKSSRPGPMVIINQLLDDGFFVEPRTIGEIINHCKDNLALTYKSTSLSPALGRVLRNGLLTRKKNSEGQFEYKQK